MRHAKRTDDNHRDVVEELRESMPELSVFDASGSGKGCPDLILGLKGRTYLVELKDKSKPPSRRKLTPAQCDFHDNWQGHVAVAHSAAEIFAEIIRDLTK